MNRPHQLPRRFWRYEVPGTWAEKLAKLSPRQQWIAEQSTLRWERRHNGGQKLTLMLGEVGRWEGVRIVPTENARREFKHRQHFDDARIRNIVEAITAAAWHHRHDETSRGLRESVWQITEPMLKHPEAAHGWVRVPVQNVHNLLDLIDPAPTKAADGLTYVFKNPMAAEVLTRLSAEVRAMTGAMKGPQDG